MFKLKTKISKLYSPIATLCIASNSLDGIGLFKEINERIILEIEYEIKSKVVDKSRIDG